MSLLDLWKEKLVRNTRFFFCKKILTFFLGAYKKKMRSRVNAGENANNIMERTALYSFMKNTKMMNFDPNQKVGDSANTFKYHPSNNKDYGQLWAPFYQSFELIDDVSDDILVGESLVSMKKFVNALKGYKKRFFSLPQSTSAIDINKQLITPAGKLWQDSRVISAAIFKKNQSKNTIKRGGEYVLFHSTHRVKRYVSYFFFLHSYLLLNFIIFLKP